MTEEHRDPDLESMAGEWSAPPPEKDFHSRVLSAYDREISHSPWWRRWPVVAAAVAAGLLLVFVVDPHAAGPEKTARYVPVQQPRFIIISQGERP